MGGKETSMRSSALCLTKKSSLIFEVETGMEDVYSNLVQWTLIEKCSTYAFLTRRR